jgi:putative oxidoreductase
MSKIAAIIGRLLLGFLFIASGIGKLMNLSIPAAMLAGAGLPANLALPVALFELVAGLCLAAGFAVRLVSLLLAVFTAGTILFFHNRFTDQMQAFEALKNLAVIGGLFLAFAHSQMWGHYYSLRNARDGELATRDAERRVHEAELRAVRAEAHAEALRTGTPAPVYADTTSDGYVEAPVRRRSRWFDW